VTAKKPGKKPQPSQKKGKKAPVPLKKSTGGSVLKNIFRWKKLYHFIEYDPDKHGSLVDVTIPDGFNKVDEYWIEDGRSLVYIVNNQKENVLELSLYEPAMTEFEYELLERIFADMRDILILSDDDLQKDRKRLLYEKMFSLLDEYGIIISQKTLFKLQYFLIRNFLGWGRLDAFMKDENLEDISCDGHLIPLFLYHRKYRNIKTNVIFDEETLNKLAITLAQRSGKHISTGSPIIDATLPGGSRLQLTFGSEVTTRGSSFTIRKFMSDPMSPIDLLNFGTFSIDELVYFWISIENNKSLLFIGGTASGKTTSLNAVSLFIPPMSKIVSIEDTREITLYHENWIASLSRESVIETGVKISMFDLLKAAMRQRPEYIIVGEVRGVEANTLFQAMNTGHTTFSTMHAGSVDAAIHRLESEPLNVPRNMLQALNIMSIQAQVFEGHTRMRRSLEIVEIAGIDPARGNVMVNTVFEWDPIKDFFTYTGRSKVYAEIMTHRGWSKEQMDAEIAARKSVIEALVAQDVHHYIEVSRIFHFYYIDPQIVLSNIGDLRSVLK